MGIVRVLQVLTIMNRGGAETMIMNYYRNIDRTKVQFDFLLHRKERGVFDDEIEQLGGKIYRLSNIGLTTLPKYQKELEVFFKTHKQYSIVHAHLNALSVFVLKAAKNNGVPHRIAHSHTSQYKINLNPFSANRDSLPFTIKYFTQNWFKSKVPKYANHYFACGKKAANWLFGKDNMDNVTIINNAIDAKLFVHNPLTATKVKQELGVSNKLVVGHVGNFVAEKNHHFLIEIFTEFTQLQKNAVLILVGGGDHSRYKKQVIDNNLEDKVLFLGVRSDVKDLLNAFDLFLFPSTNEGLPVTLIEAQAAGLKIIASDEISQELNITGLANFMSLNESYLYWAKQLLSASVYKRENTVESIINAKYDIESNALMLQEFYINNSN